MGSINIVSHARNNAKYQRASSSTLDKNFLSVEANSFQAPADQALGVFTSVIVIVALGSVVVTIQAKVESNIHGCMTSILT